MAIRSILVLLLLSTGAAGVALPACTETVDRSETVEASARDHPAETATRPQRMPPASQPARRERAAATTRVPILMYHVLNDPPEDAPFPELYVRPDDFVAQMRWLERNGYHAVTLRAVWDHWREGTPVPRKPVVISIDHGYRSTVLVAVPELRRRGWPAVVNLALHSLDVPGGLRSGQVRELIEAGWEIDAHSLTHADLTTVDDRRLRLEVAGSRKEIQHRFGVPVDFFCYPSGRHDERVVAAVRRAGFLGATTTLDGLADRDEPFTLRRVRVNRSDGLAGFVSRLEGLS